MKICTMCKEEKALTGFFRDKSRADGYEHRCKACSKKKGKAWRQANPTYMSERAAQWRRDNPDHTTNYWSDDVEGYKAYVNAHNVLRRTRGPASNYVCSCGSMAQQWAYNHTDPNEQRTRKGIRYGTPEFYNPMCIPCHRAMDTAVRDSDAA